MLVITCPFCGPRDEREFDYGGLAKAPRSEAANVTNDTEWIAYLLYPDDQGRIADEYWWHVRGCGEWVRVRRNTTTHRIEQSAEESER